MSVICPTVLAGNEADFASQISLVATFAKRIQIDLMDGDFASPKSISLEKTWWPPNLKTDIHLMYKNPEKYLARLVNLKPNMVIVHAEILLHHMHFAAELHKEGIEAGLAILPDTEIKDVEQILNSFDHLLIFSGNLGHFGGQADLELLPKVKQARIHHPNIEIGWDGGVNTDNVKQLQNGGVDVLNVGGFIQNAKEPEQAFQTLVKSIS